MPVIGGVTLNSGLYWENRLGDSGVDARMVRSRVDTPIVFEQPGGGRDFDLIGGANTGTLIQSQLQAIGALASVPGAVYDMEYNGATYPVRFRTWEQPVIEASPIAPREDMDENDIYNNVVIKLQEA